MLFTVNQVRDVSLNKVVSTLLHCAGDSLEELRIYPSRDLGGRYYSVSNGIQTLRGFSVLRHIYLDVDLLIEEECAPWCGREVGQPLLLVADMPHSLEVLELQVRCILTVEFEAIFKGLTELKGERLPYLRRIHLIYWNVDVFSFVRQVCALAEIELESTLFA